jgi:hypothetical protein
MPLGFGQQSQPQQPQPQPQPTTRAKLNQGVGDLQAKGRALAADERVKAVGDAGRKGVRKLFAAMGFRTKDEKSQPQLHSQYQGGKRRRKSRRKKRRTKRRRKSRRKRRR